MARPAVEPITLTPNHRLVRTLAATQVRRCIKRGERAWHSPRIYSWRAWARHLLIEYIAFSNDPRVPLSDEQSRAIWSEIVGEDVVVNPDRVAGMALRAWRALHEWGVPSPGSWDELELSFDSRQFQRWAARYLDIVSERGFVDEAAWLAELPDLIRAGEIPLPGRITLEGFVLPQGTAFDALMSALADAGVDIERVDANSPPAALTRQMCSDREAELFDAVGWARSQIEGGCRRVAIVVPDLAQRVDAVERCCRQVLDPPGDRLVAADTASWHISAGRSLSSWPMIADALRLLRLTTGRLFSLQFGSLLRSPFLGGWVEEADARAELDRAIRELPGDRVSLAKVIEVAEAENIECPTLLGMLRELQSVREKPRPSSLREWAERFSEELEALNFGSGRSLSSGEYQAWGAWLDTLERLAGLDLVVAAGGRDQAFELLHGLAGSRRFREENPGVPIEILTFDEIVGQQFDAVRIIGLSEIAWPGDARPDPFLPRDHQKHIPAATPEGRLELARQLLDCARASSARVLCSWPAREDDQETGPSALISDAPIVSAAANAAVPAPSPGSAETERLDADIHAPAFPGGRVRGGVSVLRHQSECPFRAFAEHRLGGRRLEHPRIGLNARARGILLHEAQEQFWLRVPSRQALEQLSPDEVRSIAAEAAERALRAVLRINPLAISAPVRKLEVERITQRLIDWAGIERERPDFTVEATEKSITVDFGTFSLRGRIDRIDRLSDGRMLLIDYKGSDVKTRDWLPDYRLLEPQLPLYAINATPAPAGIAFAQLRPDKLTYAGVGDGDIEIRGMVSADSPGRTAFRESGGWNGLFSGWQTAVQALADEFSSGHAPVAPASPDVCRRCHLKTLCRISERGAS